MVAQRPLMMGTRLMASILLLGIQISNCIVPKDVKECPLMLAVKGKIIVQPATKCTISIGETSLEFSNGEAPGRWYGVVDYDCGECVGKIESSFSTCDECVFCTHNESITTCQAFFIPIILLVLIGLMSLLVTWLTTKVLVAWCRHVLVVVKSRKVRRAESRKEKIAMIVRGLMEKPVVRVEYPPVTGSIPQSTSIAESEMEEVCCEGLEQLESSDNSDGPPEPPPRRAPNKRAWSPWSAVPLLVVMMVMMPSPPLAKACDKVFASTSVIDYCEKGKECMPLHSISMQMLPGQTACVRDKATGSQIAKMTLRETGYLDIYEKVYSTGIMKVVSKSYQRCKGAGECSADGVSCLPGNTTLVPKPLKLWMDGAGCETWGATCGTGRFYEGHCTHSVACTWGVWCARLHGPIQDMYRLFLTMWYAKVDISTTKGTYTAYLDSLTPSSDTFISVRVSPERGTSRRMPGYLLMDGHMGLRTEASAPNQPVVNTMGDVQIDQVTGTLIYPWNSIKCEVAASVHRCSFPPSALERIPSKLADWVIPFRDHESQGVIKVRERYGIGFSFYFNTASEPAMETHNASCTFQFGKLHGCVGCSAPASSLVEAQSIRATGSITVSSNCSLITKALGCYPGQQVLQLIVKGSEPCEISYGNQSVLLSPNLIYMTDLSVIALQTAKDEGAIGEGSGGLNWFDLLGSNRNFMGNLPLAFFLGGLGALAIRGVAALGGFLVFKARRK